MDITTKDVVWTAYSNARTASSRLGEVYRMKEKPSLNSLDAMVILLTKALSDTLLARHLLSPDWTDATYVGIWE